MESQSSARLRAAARRQQMVNTDFIRINKIKNLQSVVWKGPMQDSDSERRCHQNTIRLRK